MFLLFKVKPCFELFVDFPEYVNEVCCIGFDEKKVFLKSVKYGKQGCDVFSVLADACS